MTNHLLAHDHSEIDAALAATFTALAVGDVERSFHDLDIFWARLAVHIRAEHAYLFPTLLQAAQNPDLPPEAPDLENVQSTISRLRDDHDFFMHELTAAIKGLRDLRRGESQDADEVIANISEKLTAVSLRLDVHNALEESQVYPWAATLLNEAEQKSLGDKIQRDLENLPARLQTQ